jgi:hypothetical protein
MINNMPLHDPDFCGRLRDNLCFAAETAESRLRAVEIEEVNHRNQAGILKALVSIRSLIGVLENAHQSDRISSSELMLSMDQTLMKSFVHLGLTDTQEHFLTDVVNDFMQQLIALLDRGEDTHHALQQLSDQLEQLR